MTEKEYNDWFIQHIDMFASMGIMHPNSEWGKLIKICIFACEERIRLLEQRVFELEQKPPRKPRSTKKKPISE